MPRTEVTVQPANPPGLGDPVTEIQRLTSDDARRRYIASHPELLTRSVVETLAGRATSLLRVDPRQAESLIDAACWLAEQLNDDFARGKAHRSRANLAHIRGNEAQALAYYASARSLFAKSGAEIENAITASSSLQSLILHGQHEQAELDANFAREVFERHSDRLRLARLNSNYANLLFHRDRWADAARYYEAAHRDFIELGEKQDVAVCLTNMAVCHLEQQDFAQALEFYKRTRSYCEQNGLAALTADVDYNIAYLHYLRGQYTTALALYRDTRARHSDLGDQHHVDLCALNEAEIYLDLNLTSECIDLASLAYSGFSERGVRLQSAQALTVLAIAESRRGKAFLSLELLAQAQELFRLEESDRRVALIDLYRATIFCRAGRPFEGRRLAARADSTFQRALLTSKSLACRLLLARLALEEKSLSHARAFCVDALDKLRHDESPMLHFQAFFLLGDIERALGNQGAALDAYLHAHDQLALTTGAVQSEEQRIQPIDDKLVLYESLVEVLDHTEEKAQAFAFIEKAKSRSLSDLLAFRAYALPETEPGRSKLADQVRQLREELNWYYRQIDLQEMKSEERSSKDVEVLRRYSRQQENRLLRTLNLLQQTDQDFSSVQEAFSVELSAIRSTLPEDTTLLEYFFANGTVLAVVLNQERLEIVPTTLVSTVEELRRSLGSSLSRNAAEGRSSISTTSVEATLNHLSSLYEELVGPVAELLTTNRLLIVPHGQLFYLPFHAFRVGQVFLSEQHAISYSPSATAFHLARSKPHTTLPRRATVFVSSAESTDKVDHLARRLAEVVPDACLFEGSRVNEELLQSKAASAKAVHLQTSGQIRQDNPMFSTISLGSERVHLFDLFQLRLDVDLVTVAGWTPGVEAKAKGNEIVGLTRGLLYAGARCVLTALWEVGEDTWLSFSKLFYGALSSGSSREGALKEAAATLRAHHSSDPREWAAFVLYGDAQ